MENLEKEIQKCDREIDWFLAVAEKDERWLIGFVDWNWERRAIEMEQLVKDAVRTDLDDEGYVQALGRVDTHVLRLLHVGIGLATETGEFLDQLKKHIFYGKALDRTNLIEELGDGQWYQRIGCDELEVQFLEMIERNVRKLKSRYPEKFTEEKAMNRDLEKEREILEREQPREEDACANGHDFSYAIHPAGKCRRCGVHD